MVILSRAAFEEISAQMASLRAMLDQRDETIRHLTDQLVDMKREGFVRREPATLSRVESELDPRIMGAIRTMAPEGSGLERQLMDFATASLLSENEIEDVADMILSGSNFGDDD
jgi:hypothetical protein